MTWEVAIRGSLPQVTLSTQQAYKGWAAVAEWLRRLTRNQIPSGSVGSNPTGCEHFFFHPRNLYLIQHPSHRFHFHLIIAPPFAKRFHENSSSVSPLTASSRTFILTIRARFFYPVESNGKSRGISESGKDKFDAWNCVENCSWALNTMN